eukprot:6189797-Pleurochrysis_carterae.AAC.2
MRGVTRSQTKVQGPQLAPSQNCESREKNVRRCASRYFDLRKRNTSETPAIDSPDITACKGSLTACKSSDGQTFLKILYKCNTTDRRMCQCPTLVPERAATSLERTFNLEDHLSTMSSRSASCSANKHPRSID